MCFFKYRKLMDSSLPSYVLVHNLNWLSIFPLVKIFFKRGSFFVYYYDLSPGGLRLMSLLRLLGVVAQDPIQIKDIMKMDLPRASIWNIRHQAFRACSNQLKNIENITKTCLPFIKSSEIKFYSINVRKAWEAWLAPSLLLRRAGKYLADEKDLPLQQVVMVSPFASLIRILEFDLNSAEDIEVIHQPFGNKSSLYLLGAFFLSFWRLLRKGKCLLLKLTKFSAPLKKESQNVGIEAAWNLASPDHPNEVSLDDLFWWRKSRISSERIKYLYNRKEIQPTVERLQKTEALGVESIILDSKFCMDTHELVLKKPEPHKTLGNLFNGLLFSGRLLFLNFFSDEQTRSVVSLINWYYIKSEGLADIFKSLRIRAVFFYNEGGFDLFSLAAKSADAIRIGFQWTSLLGIEGNVTARSHDVFFFWGQHDIKLALDSGCTTKHMLLSGCFFNGLSNLQARDEVKSLADDFRQRGVSYVITLLGTSGATPNFYQFFVKWLIEDPKLGLLIKDKKFSNWADLTDLQASHSLDKSFGEILYRAQDTQRIHLLHRKISPADAALAADFSVGIGSISSTTVAALQGAKVFFVDYEQLDEGPQNPYTTFHSLGPNRCIFYDLEALKKAVINYAANPKSNPNLGDASPILKRLDAFGDQKASDRIAEYVEWYLEALNIGLTRDEASLSATKKYAEKWGKDKVVRGL
jgi:hypothetical protein